MASLPAFPVTGVGSLPHHDPDAAVDLIARHCPFVPFWPQLPRRGRHEGMIAQCLVGLEDLLVFDPRSHEWRLPPSRRRDAVTRLYDACGLTPDSAAGLAAFERGLAADKFTRAVLIKGQIAGPITLAASLRTGSGTALDDAELVDALAARVVTLARAQGARLACAGRPVVIEVDEPALGSLSTPPPEHALAALERGLKTAVGPNVHRGLHCCGEMPLALLDRLDPALYSFDAHSGMTTFCADPAARRFIERGRLVALGAVPTTSSTTFDAAAAARNWRAATTDLDHAALASRTIVTASCGLATLSVDAAGQSFVRAHELATALREAAARPRTDRTP